MISDLARELERIIEEGLDRSYIPYVKGNSIRIKHLVIRKSKMGWLVYDTKINKQINRYFSKAAALAAAKCIADGNDLTKKIDYLDQKIEKNYHDSLFYRHAFKTSTTVSKKAIVLNRLEIALAATQAARCSLDTIIFN
jgi:hypothetical protein